MRRDVHDLGQFAALMLVCHDVAHSIGLNFGQIELPYDLHPAWSLVIMSVLYAGIELV